MKGRKEEEVMKLNCLDLMRVERAEIWLETTMRRSDRKRNKSNGRFDEAFDVVIVDGRQNTIVVLLFCWCFWKKESRTRSSAICAFNPFTWTRLHRSRQVNRSGSTISQRHSFHDSQFWIRTIEESECNWALFYVEFQDFLHYFCSNGNWKHRFSAL